MATTRTAQTHWEGTLFEGAGQVTLESSGLGTYDVSWPARAEEANGKTSPEELIAAAHSACFSMAFSNGLAKAGTPPPRWTPRPRSSSRPAPASPASTSPSSAPSTGISEEDFVAAAEDAKANCPVSQALTGTTITLDGLAGLSRRRVGTARASSCRPARPAGGRRRLVGFGALDRHVAVPDHPLGERDLDALVVEAGLDPLAHLAGDRPLLQRRGLEHHPDA